MNNKLKKNIKLFYIDPFFHLRFCGFSLIKIVLSSLDGLDDARSGSDLDQTRLSRLDGLDDARSGPYLTSDCQKIFPHGLKNNLFNIQIAYNPLLN